MRSRSPANVFLHRAQLIFVLAALIPTVLMTLVGIVLLTTGGSRSMAVVAGVLTVAFCASSLTGYILGTVFVTRGASLAYVQNEFLSAVSHELRTPLTSMKMFIETLRDERVTDPAEKQRCLTIIHQEMSRLDGLVGRLISLSKIEAGRHGFEKRSVQVREVIDEARVGFEAMKLGDDVVLEVDVADDLIIQGDRSALAQAVSNLLANAWKYTGADKKISVHAHAQGPKQVVIAVRDNGQGIPLDEQDKVFEKFERGASAMDSRTSGSGLGLAIVRAIVRAHRGKVELSSRPERGTEFRILLPRSA